VLTILIAVVVIVLLGSINEKLGKIIELLDDEQEPDSPDKQRDS